MIMTSYLHFEDQPHCSDFSTYYETITKLSKSDINSPESIDQLLEKLQQNEVALNAQTSEKSAVPSLKQLNLLTDSTKNQYIEVRPATANEANFALLYSAKFYHNNTIWKLDGETGLLTVGNNFVAKVSIEPNDELNNATDFEVGREKLLGSIVEMKVLMDDLQEEAVVATGSIQSELMHVASQCATDPDSAKCLLDFWRITKQHNFNLTEEAAKEICASKYINNNVLKSKVTEFAQMNSELDQRLKLWKTVKAYIQRKANINGNFLKEHIDDSFKRHMKNILSSNLCSHEMKHSLEQLKPECFLLIGEADLKLFSDLECALDKTIFDEIIPNIRTNFIDCIIAIKAEDYLQYLPVTNGIFFYVCKGLIEIESRISKELGLINLIQYDNHEWKTESVSDSSKNSAMARCLIRQLEMLCHFANHFQPGKLTAKEKFPQKFQKRSFGDLDHLSVENHMWLLLVEATIEYIYRQESSHQEGLEDVLNKYYKYITTHNTESGAQETNRIITHDILELVAQHAQSKVSENKLKIEILTMEMKFMDMALLCAKSDTNVYRDIINVFKTFWKELNITLSELSVKLEGIYFEKNVEELQNKLIYIVYINLDKTNIQLEDVINFFRAYNDFLIDIKKLPLEWYVRPSNETIKHQLLETQCLQTVENKFKNTNNECYLVTKSHYDKFVETYSDNAVPKHYQLQIISTFLEYISEVSIKTKWHQIIIREVDQLHATIALISAIRSSLMYLKDQLDYVNFDIYFDETINPFTNVIFNSEPLESFTKRLAVIKDFFCFLRNQNSIRIDDTLQMFADNNDNFEHEVLKNAYKLYNETFVNYMHNCKDDKNRPSNIQDIVEDVLSQSRPHLFSEWTAEFKQKIVPTILAGLGAVWSIMVSTDITSSENCLKPHIIQVITVLRLLCVDTQGDGVEKHLAQILTGQGKSLVLAMLASVLALFGHDVVIVCYSDYLAKRDSDDFRDFYFMFAIAESKVSYKTFKQMACEQVDFLYKKSIQHINNKLGIANKHINFAKNKRDLISSVLLIDEVDVFFMDKFYGNSLNSIYLPKVPGLAILQRKIWQLVVKEENNVERAITQFLNSSTDSDVQNLKSFISKQGSYKIIADGEEQQYTNQTLFQKHLGSMIQSAKVVFGRSDSDITHHFRLESNGTVSCKDSFGVFRKLVYNGYDNTFVYFKLKKDGFVDNVGGHDNFGYIVLNITSFSYAKLPEKYPLILGVTGTLTGLTEYEKRAIECHYKITQKSIMPSFYGASNLKFDATTNFKCLTDNISWRKAIFTQINAITQANRSVIVFFENENAIVQFRQDFSSKLDRLVEITANTEKETRDRYINEAGLSRTVTLATREMGRGIDYKSSLTVEKNGGIHIIQSFFSIDEKEEAQIKGRTGRKDNQGSYELIVCQQHLKTQQLIKREHEGNSVKYSDLTMSRNRLVAEASKEKDKKLERANDLHKKSLKFCEDL